VSAFLWIVQCVGLVRSLFEAALESMVLLDWVLLYNKLCPNTNFCCPAKVAPFNLSHVCRVKIDY
jgi:hypothetical protein